MSLWWQSPITYSINKGGGARGVIQMPHKPPHKTLPATASRPNSEALAAHIVLAHPRAAFHPCTCGLHRGTALLIGYDEVTVPAKTTTRRKGSWLSTSSTLTCDYVGSLLQLFLRCLACSVVTVIYEPFTCKFTECNGWCRVSLTYRFHFL
jgi:hypothetical protein